MSLATFSTALVVAYVMFATVVKMAMNLKIMSVSALLAKQLVMLTFIV